MSNPAVDRFPEHSMLMGKVILSYPELVLTFAHCVGLALGLRYEFFAALKNVQSESLQIEMGVGLASKAMVDRGFGAEFATCASDLQHCGKIRNHYAHATLTDYRDHLYAINLRKENLEEDYTLQEVLVPSLEKQLIFFAATRGMLLYLESHLSDRLHHQKPKLVARPPLSDRNLKRSELDVLIMSGGIPSMANDTNQR